MLGAVAAEAFDEASQHEVPIGLEHHVDEVDDDDSPDVAQTQLPHDFVGGFEVVLCHRFLEVSTGADELPGVDVDHRHGLGAVDDE